MPWNAAEVQLAAPCGAEKLANRNLGSGLYQLMLNGSNTCHYDLQVSKDGTKATITTTYPSTVTMGAGENSADVFATFTVRTRLVVDLVSEVPTVIDASFAQTLD